MSANHQAYPLSWPTGWRRTSLSERETARFHGNTARASTAFPGKTYRIARPLTLAEGVDRLRMELERMGAQSLVISTNVPVRLDGLPRGGAREPDDPGAVAYWTTAEGQPRCMAIDKYDRVADNIAAIAGTVAALRAVERYGGALILERAFTGFSALPETASASSWHGVLGVGAHSTEAEIRQAYRRAALAAHPDRGGSHEAMARVNEAYAEALRNLGVPA